MRKSELTMYFKNDIKKVWDVVTNNEDYIWRSDIVEVKIKDENTFEEYYPGGNFTTFTITKKQPYTVYQFDMKNKLFNGRWIGEFSETEQKGTRLIFTEEISIPNPMIRVLSYIGMNLKKMQKQYYKDLQNKLKEE